MRIEEEYKKTGYFWLPDNHDKKIPGILTITDGGKIELEVVGLFDESIEAINSNDDLKRIIGHVEKDGLVTLDNCFYIQKNYAFGGISKSKILVNSALSGAAWDEDEEITFNAFSFSVDCFDEWVGISGIVVDSDWDKKTATINFQPPESISFQLDNGMCLKICFAYTLPGFPNITEARITQRAYFKITSEELRNISEFKEVAFKLTNLMCFAMDEVVSMRNVSATSSEILLDREGEGGRSAPISIYYQSIPYSEKVPVRSWHDMLFNFSSIKNNAQDIFNNWINAYDYLSPALGLYFSTRFGAQKYLDGKFLALAQGLETYHRRSSDETSMGEEEYDKLVNSIVENCPDNHVEWLSGRLAHGNEINLGRRLKRIIEPFKDHLGSSRDRNKLLRKIVDTRNYLTHYSKDLKDQAAEGRELWLLCLKMEVIFNLHFLKVIGFTDVEISGVVANCHSLRRKMDEK